MRFRWAEEFRNCAVPQYFFSRDKKEAMNNALIWVFGIMLALVMGILPFGYFSGMAQALNVSDPLGIPMLIGFVVLVAVISFLAALGSGTLAQSSNCGEVKSMSRVASNAGIGMAIEVVFVCIGLFVPMLGTITSDYFLAGSVGSPSSTGVDKVMAKQVDVGFWAAWGAMYAIIVAATGSATC